MPKGRKKKGGKAVRFKRLVWILFYSAAFAAFCAILTYGFVIISGNRFLAANLDKLDLPEASVVYDRDGNEALKLFYLENRDRVPLGEVPELLQKAFIATEDRRFEEHEGIDFWAIGRALVKDIIHRKKVEGGSTITQQLAKNLFLTGEKTFFRKATEASIALALENRLTKDEILELYLNRIYFGHAAYGIKAAAQTYFGKSDLGELTLAEMATLAAIPKAPNVYNPIDAPERALERRNTVLALMAEQGIISGEEKAAAQAEEMKVVRGAGTRRFPTYTDMVIEEAMRVTGLTEEQLHLGGYAIHTTLDVKAQTALEEAYRNKELFPEDGPEQQVQSAMVILDNRDGGIAAIIGGRDYVRKGLNRAVMKRQPGSAFKPIAVFAPAIETGKWDPYSLLSNERQSFGGYSPRNLNGKYGGRVTMLEAARRSLNVPAVWLLNEIGVSEGVKFAEQLGIAMAKEDRNLSIALGGLTNGASPLEMARAYSAFANHGKLYDVHAITAIRDKYGNTIYEHKVSAQQVMQERTAWYTTLLLKEVVSSGTGTKARIKGHETAGKTGTTQSGIEGVGGNRDVWFVGYTRDYTAAVWMGFDKTDKKHVLSDTSSAAAALFSRVLGEALEGRGPTRLEKPAGVKDPVRPLEPVTGLTAEYVEDSGEVRIEWTPREGTVEYRLYRKSSADEDFQMILPTAQTAVRDFAVLPGHVYQYYVTVYDPGTGKESMPSGIVSVEVPSAGEDEGLIPGDEAGDGEWPDIEIPPPEPPVSDEGESGGTGHVEDGGNGAGTPDDRDGDGTDVDASGRSGPGAGSNVREEEAGADARGGGTAGGGANAENGVIGQERGFSLNPPGENRAAGF